ncbi:hypothetical protein K435DRAFT_384196 [Dendrothele bispora CBS 962.96]|uniref:Uncharacterized protein n=1 Tax=Dendrothele bispora (strain CBS 962.96) TaxID=1314807 RepID=A0A4S8LA87_DENBC|nr:hypothetical protein K435DRAFT_384196 [Dendrothele bispora CBS 962.96]
MHLISPLMTHHHSTQRQTSAISLLSTSILSVLFFRPQTEALHSSLTHTTLHLISFGYRSRAPSLLVSPFFPLLLPLCPSDYHKLRVGDSCPAPQIWLASGPGFHVPHKCSLTSASIIILFITRIARTHAVSYLNPHIWACG